MRVGIAGTHEMATIFSASSMRLFHCKKNNLETGVPLQGIGAEDPRTQKDRKMRLSRWKALVGPGRV